jgi:hypothetical protein
VPTAPSAPATTNYTQEIAIAPRVAPREPVELQRQAPAPRRVPPPELPSSDARIASDSLTRLQESDVTRGVAPNAPSPPAAAPAPQLASPAPQAFPSQSRAFSAGALSANGGHAAAGKLNSLSVGAGSLNSEAMRAPPADPAAALHQAAENGDTTRISALLDARADINSRDPYGRTALMLAIIHGRPQVVTALLARGADPNAADSTGMTPLQAAAITNDPAIIDALRRAGAR